MPGWRLVGLAVLGAFVVLATACGGGNGDVALHWQTEDGSALRVDIADLDVNYETHIIIDNDSGKTIRNAVIRFSPTELENVPAGFSVGTISPVRTEFDGPAHLWSLGDIRPNTRVILPISLLFSAASQLGAAPPVDLTVTLESSDLQSGVEGLLTVQFVHKDAVAP